jgi:hypothetical protein
MAAGAGSGGDGGSGGAVYTSGTVTIKSSTISGCFAGTGGESGFSNGMIDNVDGRTGTGGAVYSAGGGIIRLSRLVHNNAEGVSVYGGNPIDATNSWWGTNNGPSSSDTGGSVTITPWLILTATAVPSTITTSQTSSIEALFAFNSAGADITGIGPVAEGIPVEFVPTTGGSISPESVNTTSGKSVSIFTPPGSAGNGLIKLIIDDSSSFTLIMITSGGSGTGSATSIVIDPVTPANVYTGVDGSGIYRSTTSGGSWTGATTQPANTHIRALVIKPAAPATLFAGTYGGGVYTSADSGDHWTACPNTGLANLNVLSLVSNSTGGLYAGTENGVYTSSDCNTWTAINGGLP